MKGVFIHLIPFSVLLCATLEQTEVVASPWVWGNRHRQPCKILQQKALFPWGSTKRRAETLLERGGEVSTAGVVDQTDIGNTFRNETSGTPSSLVEQGPSDSNEQNNNKGKWRSSLPDNLRAKNSETLQKLRLGQTDIYLLGTAHVSNDSAADTRILLDHIQPECVFVELCDMRIAMLEGSDEDEREVDHNMTFFQKVREARGPDGGSRLFAIFSILLTSWQEESAAILGAELGGEFQQAHKYWLQHPTAHLVLGDRPLSLTLFRAWESLSWWPKIKVVLGLLWSSLRKPNKAEIKKWLESIMKEESDVLTKSMMELRQNFPSLYVTIIEERDAWLAAKLFQTCRALQGQRTTIVAIIGAGHVEGVCRWLTNPSAATPEQILSDLVSTKKWSKDDVIQKEAIPVWIHHVSELQRRD